MNQLKPSKLILSLIAEVSQRAKLHISDVGFEPFQSAIECDLGDGMPCLVIEQPQPDGCPVKLVDLLRRSYIRRTLFAVGAIATK